MDTPHMMRLYKEWVFEKTQGRPEFAEELRQVAIRSLDSDDTTWIRKGIHALAVVGKADDIPLVKALLTHDASNVSKDAATCVWEFEHRVP